MQFFYILGLKIEEIFFYYRKHKKDVNTTMARHLLTAMIGPTDWPVARRMKPKKEKK